MAWYQRARDKAAIRELEADFERRTGRYVELVNAIGDVLARLKDGAVDEAIRRLEIHYEDHKRELEQQDSQEPRDHFCR